MLNSALAFDPEKQFGTENRITGQDYILALFVALIVAIANLLYVLDLFMLWHDDNQSYYASTLGQILNRVGGTVSRHVVVDNLMLHVMANGSPYVARALVIFLGAVPLAVMTFFTLRLGFGVGRAGAVLGSALPLVLAGQHEIFVGINLSYVVFDMVMFFSALLLIIWMYRTRSWGAVITGSIAAAILLAEGIVSSVLVAPALIFFAALFGSVNWPQRLVPIAAIALATLKSAREQSALGRADMSETPIAAVLSNLPRPLDFILPGGPGVAWFVLALLIAIALYAVFVAIRSRSFVFVTGMGMAAALYMVPVVLYSVGRPGFPNRYAFIPAIGLAVALAVVVHLLAVWLDERAKGSDWLSKHRIVGDMMPTTFAAILAVFAMGYQKSQHVDPIFGLISNTTKMVSEYFNPRANPISIAAQETSGTQLIVLAESGFPYMYPHRYPALGYLRFVTGDDRAVGFAGNRKLCATPFEPWGGPWQFGPGGFAEDLPGRIVAFRGENGTGAELSHVLSTEASALDTAEGPQAWTLYRFDQSGAESLAEGAGRAALEAALGERDLQPHQLAFSCGL